MRNGRECLVASLGFSMARIETAKAGGVGNPCLNGTLYIVTPSASEEHTHAPAESVQIYGLDNLMALRDLLNEGIKIAHEGASTEPLVQEVINKNAGV